MTFSRRNFVLSVGAAAGATALGSTGSLLGQPASNPIFLMVFLRGGADGVQMMVPNSGHGRSRYNEWRPRNANKAIHIPKFNSGEAGAGLRLDGGRFDAHPELRPLIRGDDNPFRNGHLAFVGGTAGAVENRSHFQQMDLIESGSNNGTPRSSGYLQRALEAMGATEDPLGSISLNSEIPLMLRGDQSQGLAIRDFNTFGDLVDDTFDPAGGWDITPRLRQAYVNGRTPCDASAVCRAGSKGIDAVEAVRNMPTGETPGSGNMSSALRSLIQLVKADSANQFRVCTLDVGGWDTHTDEANRFRSNIRGLATALRAMYDEARSLGIWYRFTVVVHSEFGRRLYQNGTDGTDHGYGGVSLVMGRRLRGKVIADELFPNTNDSDPFYQTADTAGVVRKVVDIRQVLSEALIERVGLPAARLNEVFPGFSLQGSKVFRPLA